MRKLVSLLLFLGSFQVNAQDNNFNRSPVTFLSPDATQFVRYGVNPVDYSTGIPNISIPLYKVTCGNLSLPIDMSYNASGIKVLDIAGTIGLGWSLNAGGLISRTVMGTNDQENRQKAFLSATEVASAFQYCRDNLTYYNVQDLVERINNIFVNSSQQKESQSDRFFYSFNGRSGIFRTDFQTGEAKTVPYSPLKISTGINNAGPYKITAEDGTNYYFEQPEFSGSNPGNSYNTSFYLTKIESSDHLHAINIYYKQDEQVFQFIKSYQLEHRIIRGPTPLSPEYTAPDRFSTLMHDNEFVSQSTPVMPERITTDNETVLFEYIADRPDLRASRLLNIKIMNRLSGEITKVLEFQQSYFGTAAANNQRLRLDILSVKDNSGASGQQYGFGYNSTALPPYYRQVGMSEHHNVDYWGYYNAADDPNLIPKEMFDPVREMAYVSPGDCYFTPQEKAMYGGNRNPNPATVQACILNEIRYPTGGKTNFEYELNRVQNGYAYFPEFQTPAEYGGLRVKKITNTADAVSPPIIKEYSYSEGRATMMQSGIYQYNTPSSYWEDYINAGIPSSVSVSNSISSTISTDPLIQMSTGSGTLVLYDDVVEYDGTAASNNGYTEYMYDYSSLSSYIFDPGPGGNPLQNGFYLADYGHYKPQLFKKIVFGKDPGNQIKEIKREEYVYNSFNTGSFITGVKIQRNYPFIKTGTIVSRTDTDLGCSGGTGSSACQSGLGLLLSHYSYSNTTGILDVPLLVEKKEIVHPSSGTGDLTISTTYTYDLVTLQPVKEQVINSRLETIISENKYPKDFAPAEPYNSMVGKNILSPVIQKSEYKNTVSEGNFIRSTKTNYDFWNGNDWSVPVTNVILPRTVQTRSKNQAVYETRQRFFSYDTKGNLTSLAKEYDARKTYLWGYNKTYPVAEISGVDFVTASSYINQTILDNPADDASLRSELGKLRNIPNALVTTYTYKPLVGISSQSDFNGRITYYEYDASGRLILIRDHDHNIIKKICYNYSGQAESCNIYYSGSKSGIFTRAGCTGCLQGSNMTYSVPANKYISTISQADADQMAQAEVDNNGQSFADANGVCTTPSQGNINQFNTTSSNIYITFYNTCTGASFNYTANIGSGLLGQVPSGIYNVTMSPAFSGTYSYRINGYLQRTSTGANFYTITLNGTSQVIITN